MMTPTLFLLEPELRSLTGRIQRSAQVRVLRSMGIEHRIRPDGSVAVLRDHIQKIFDGAPSTSKRETRTVMPRWDAI